jgi:hypothetical protein
MFNMDWIGDYLKAGNSKTPKNKLISLALSEHTKVRMRVAENPKTPKETLERLAQDQSADVRLAVSTNHCCPPEIIDKLARDPDPSVRFGIAENPATAHKVLQLLTEDENAYISHRALKTLNILTEYEKKCNNSHQLFAWPSQNLRSYA